MSSEEKWMIHHVRDLGSKYKFPPLVARSMTGARVAEHLEGLFKRYGPPVVLKRDNGADLNSAEVNAVLREYRVLPLNSPEHYPPYNGSIEEAQKELKECLRRWQACSKSEVSEEAIQQWVQLSAHDLNHKARRCLSGKNLCTVFFNEKEKYTYHKRQRQDIQQGSMYNNGNRR